MRFELKPRRSSALLRARIRLRAAKVEQHGAARQLDASRTPTDAGATTQTRHRNGSRFSRIAYEWDASYWSLCWITTTRWLRGSSSWNGTRNAANSTSRWFLSASPVSTSRSGFAGRSNGPSAAWCPFSVRECTTGRRKCSLNGVVWRAARPGLGWKTADADSESYHAIRGQHSQWRDRQMDEANFRGE